MVKRITISLEDGVYEVLQQYSEKLDVRPTTACRDLILQRLAEMSLITAKIKGGE